MLIFLSSYQYISATHFDQWLEFLLSRIARLEQLLATSKKREAATQDSLDVALREMDKGAEVCPSSIFLMRERILTYVCFRFAYTNLSITIFIFV